MTVHHSRLAMSGVLETVNGSESLDEIVNISNSESINDIIYESTMADMELQAEDIGR